MAQTSQQIIIRACYIAKAPGFTVQAGQYLNLILQDLCQTYDFDFIRELQILNISPLANLPSGLAQGYAMNADHLRTREVFYYVGGQPFYLSQMPIERFDQLFNGPGVSNYPENYAIRTETTPYTMYFYEPPQIPLSVNIRYQPQMPDITTPETSSVIPWFPNQRYLIKRLSAYLMDETDDARQEKFEKQAEEILDKFLIMKDDKENYAQTVKLDPLRFGSRSSLKPTKQQPL